MKALKKAIALSIAAIIGISPQLSRAKADNSSYTPTEEIVEAQRQFRNSGLGIFIHWGIYSMYGQNEWYLNRGVKADEYAKAAAGFFPGNFNAGQWVKAFKEAGAEYICFTTRHHDGFSMWHTAQSDYNIVDATPFKRDILREISEECRKQGMRLHLYYSHIDWTRPDYPSGRTGLKTGRDSTLVDWPSYYSFMNNQLTELLTQYGPIGAIWFDGWWDHDEDATPFDWQLDHQYALIHKLQPSCLIGNNHHQTPFAGENIQIFERDLPGENTAGLSGQAISRLPLETCLTMNRSWGYNVEDLDYLDSSDLIRTLVRTAGKGANLLLNVGPQPDGSLPDQALKRLATIGKWMDRYALTIRPTGAAEFGEQPWGVATVNGDSMFIHILDLDATEIAVPIAGKRVTAVNDFITGDKVKLKKAADSVTLYPGERQKDSPDHVIVIKLKK